jgi:hypothetical protein
VPHDARQNIDLMSHEYRSMWEQVAANLVQAASNAQDWGAHRDDYGRTVQEVYKSSVQLALASCESTGAGPRVRGATATVVAALLQALMLLPTGRWLPAAAVALLTRAIANMQPLVAAQGDSAAAANAAIDLLVDYSILER